MLFDATHSVQINNSIRIADFLEFPSAAELAMVQEASREDDERVRTLDIWAAALNLLLEMTPTRTLYGSTE